MKHHWLTILILLVAIDGWAAAPLTIDEAVREALASSPQIHEGEAYRQAAEFATNATRAEFLPRLSASYAYQNLADSPFINIYGNQVTTNTRDQHHWEIALHQPIFSGFAISARHRLAQLGLATRTLDLQQARQKVIVQVKQGCFDLLVAEKKLDVTESSVTALTAHETDVEKFYAKGLVPLNDLLKARVARGDAVLQQHRAQAGVRQARSALCLQLGRDFDDGLEIAEAIPVITPLPELSAQVEGAMANRSEIALLERAIESKSSEQRVVKSDYYPNVELFGRYQQDGEDLGARTNEYANQHNASVGVQASWEIFTFGKTRSRCAEAAAERRALEQTLEKIRDDIRLQVVQARLDLDVAQGNIDTARTALNQAQEHWRITDRLYRQQLTTTTEVLDARSYLDRARSAFYEAQYGYGSSLALLEWAMGKP
ncbi:TolC family protein [uncultured Desulfosarcina sp.]|uniref:TolC family protein n=1 Tax=uncultured Desulfosarcina sp. TaxID=218289 RepID=UPI0029C72A8C|nr:TolC family protein [uncultured Desulfosarcina sp.]